MNVKRGENSNEDDEDQHLLSDSQIRRIFTNHHASKWLQDSLLSLDASTVGDEEYQSQSQNETRHRMQREIQEANRDLQEQVQIMKDKIDNMEVKEGEYRAEIQQMNDELTKLKGDGGEGDDGRYSPVSLFRSFRSISTLANDTFSLMMISEPCSQSWLLGIIAFAFQMILGIMIALDQIEDGYESSAFDIPFKVDNVVYVGQFLTIILCISTQSDVLTSIQLFVLLGKGSAWEKIVGDDENESTPSWATRILLPNLLKLTQGLLVTFVSLIIIVQSDNIIDLLKDFTALMVLAETDNILFYLADYGYLGRDLQMKAIKAKFIEIEKSSEPDQGTIDNANQASSNPGHDVDDDSIDDWQSDSFHDVRQSVSDGDASVDQTRSFRDPNPSPSAVEREDRHFYFRSIALTALAVPMFSGWILIIRNQLSGVYFHQMYPNCTAPNAFKLAREHFGDDECFGGPLNTLGCGFEGGDCVNFNLAFPLCKGISLTNVEKRVGDGFCDQDLSMFECDFDGGDCCSQNVTSNAMFGDGQCNGGTANTKVCAFDNGDCNEFHRNFPDCPLDELSDIEGASEVILGNGICEGGIYSISECGFEYGDCNQGQVGQDLAIHGIRSGSSLDFDMIMSLDGSKIAVGLPFCDQNNNHDFSSPGVVRVYGYDPLKKVWVKIGNDLLGDEAGDEFGWSIALNTDGTRLAIGARRNKGKLSYEDSGKVKVFDFNQVHQDWTEVSSSASGEQPGFFFVDMSADGSQVAASAPYNGGNWAGQVKIFEMNPNLELDGNIMGENFFDYIGLYSIKLMSSSSDTLSRVAISSKSDDDAVMKVFEYSMIGRGWTQLGEDINNPYPGSSTISSNGGRIAISSFAMSKDSAGKVEVFDFDSTSNVWGQVGDPISGTFSKNGDGFGRSMAMSGDGNLLAIGSVDVKCDTDSFCATGSVEIYAYDSNAHDRFQKVPPKKFNFFGTGNIIEERQRERGNSIFGLHLSLSDDATLLSISGYNMNTDHGYVKVYNLDELFYTKCAVPSPDQIGDGRCSGALPYNSIECGFDGGDCPSPSPAPSVDPFIVNCTFHLKTDSFPSNISWTLLDDTGLFKRAGPKPGQVYEANTLYSFEWKLKECTPYTFIIKDSNGNGLVHSPSGFFTMLINGQRVMGESDGTAFGAEDRIDIFSCPTPVPSQSPSISVSPTMPVGSGGPTFGTGAPFTDLPTTIYTFPPVPIPDTMSCIFVLLTDNYPSDISWTLTDSRGSSGSFPRAGPKPNEEYKPNTLYTFEWTIYQCTEYIFEISDNFGDGILSPGYFQIFIEGKRLVGESDGVDFGSSERLVIYYCP